MKKHKMNKGGKVKHAAKHEEKKETHVEHHHYKKGGEVHKAKGEKSKHRADKRARGGRMTPSSPLSGAKPTKERPGAKMGGTPDKEND